MDWMIEAGTWAALFTVALAAVQHTLLADWWRSKMGRSLMLAKLAVVVLLVNPLLAHYLYHLPPSPEGVLPWTAVTARWLIAGVYAHRIWAREIRRRRLNSPPPVISGGAIPRSTRRAHEDAG